MLGALTFAVAVVPFGPAGEKTKIEWILKEDDVFHVEHTVLRKETLETKGKSLRKASVLTTNFSFTVKEKAGGSMVVVQKIESMKHKSDANDPPGALVEKMAGGTFTVGLGPGPKITKFDGYEAFIKKLADGNADLDKTARQLLPEDVLRQPSEDLWTFLPGRAVAKGDQWRREASFSLAPFGAFRGTQLYTYDGPDKAGEVITSKSTMAFIPQTTGAGPFRISRALLKTETPSGRYVFDAAAGRLSQATNSMPIKGQLSIDVNGNVVDMDITIEQTTTMRVQAQEK